MAGVMVALPTSTYGNYANPTKIAIVGAGVVGMSVAYTVKKTHPLTQVVVIAEKFLENTTSYGAAGLWEPYKLEGTPEEKVNVWSKTTFNHFMDVYNSADAGAAGVQLVTAYQLYRDGEFKNDPFWKDIVHNYQQLSAEELTEMKVPKIYTKAMTFGTFVADQSYYLPWLMAECKGLGVEFVQRRLESISELDTEWYAAIVNCCGLGAVELVGDKNMDPIRGQVVRVKSPHTKACYFFDDSYIIPNLDWVVVGGTAQKGNWSTDNSIADTKRILDDVCNVFPSIGQLPVHSVWAGLRPWRSELRLEQEDRGALAPIIHNYGHGGSGITVGMGCAVQILDDYLEKIIANPPRSRL